MLGAQEHPGRDLGLLYRCGLLPRVVLLAQPPTSTPHGLLPTGQHHILGTMLNILLRWQDENHG